MATKKQIVFGVELTSFQAMKFGKYRAIKGIAMNTLQPEERTEFVKKFLSQDDGIS